MHTNVFCAQTMRLMTNYCQLNNSLAQPEWPFMSSKAVRRQLDPEARVFEALDLTSGCSKVLLSEKYEDLMTFTYLFGCFRYKVLLMGIILSSDLFNIISDI